MTVTTAPFIKQLLAANGGSNGILVVASTLNLRQGATVYLSAAGLSTKTLIIDAILSATEIAVRDPSANTFTRFDSSAYTTTLGATLTQPEQTDFISNATEFVTLQGGDGTDVDVTLVGPHKALKVDVVGSPTVSLPPLGAIKATALSVGTSAVQVTPTPLVNRKGLLIKAITTSGQFIYVGESASVATSGPTTGFLLGNGDTIAMDASDTMSIWVIATAASQTLYILEASE